MFEIDKKKFSAFVSDIRREKGFTQKELASGSFDRKFNLLYHE